MLRNYAARQRAKAITVVCLLVVALLSGCAGKASKTPAGAPGAKPTGPAPAEFFAGKTITLIVPFDPGGGFDRQARLFAPYFEKETKSTIVIKNVSGANGMVGASQLKTAAPDGLTIGLMFGTAMVLHQITEGEKALFDVDKFSYIGRISNLDNVLAIRSTLPYKSLADLAAAKQPLKLGAPGPSDLAAVQPRLATKALSTPFQVFAGYIGGTKDVQRAFVSKEIDGYVASYATVKPQVASGEMRLLVQFTQEREKSMPDVPTVLESVKDPQQKALAEALTAFSETGRVLMAPPGVDPERLKYLQQAFQNVMNIAEFKEKAASSGTDLKFLDAPATAEAVRKILVKPDAALKQTLVQVIQTKE